MNLSELRTEVYTLTNRPDLEAQTLTAVRAATLKLHQKDFYSKDLFETGVQFTTAEYLQQIEYRALIPRWRALKYLRKTNSAGTEQGKFFDVVVPENVLDGYNQSRTDICYLAGEALQIKSSTEIQYAILGCYVNPNITELGYDSWIAQDHPYAIVFDAAATVFKAVGDTDQFAAYTQLAAEQAQLIQVSNILAQGY